MFSWVAWWRFSWFLSHRFPHFISNCSASVEILRCNVQLTLLGTIKHAYGTSIAFFARRKRAFPSLFSRLQSPWPTPNECWRRQRGVVTRQHARRVRSWERGFSLACVWTCRTFFVIKQSGTREYLPASIVKICIFYLHLKFCKFVACLTAATNELGMTVILLQQFHDSQHRVIIICCSLRKNCSAVASATAVLGCSGVERRAAWALFRSRLAVSW